ncbi:unnamed protein product, partial [marine sediment metagenome]
DLDSPLAQYSGPFQDSNLSSSIKTGAGTSPWYYIDRFNNSYDIFNVTVMTAASPAINFQRKFNIKNDELKKELRKLAVPQRFVMKAAVIFVVLGDKELSPYMYKVDIGIAVQQMALQAAELGLGSCWLGAFDRDKTKDFLKVPNPWTVVALFLVGIPDEIPPDRPRKSLDELFVNDSFQ